MNSCRSNSSDAATNNTDARARLANRPVEYRRHLELKIKNSLPDPVRMSEAETIHARKHAANHPILGRQSMSRQLAGKSRRRDRNNWPVLGTRLQTA